MARLSEYYKIVAPSLVASGYSPTSFAPFVADLNHDGFEDLLVLGASYPFESAAEPVGQPGQVLFSDGLGGFAPAPAGFFSLSTLLTIHPRKVVVADYNGDGRSDVFIATHGWDMVPFPGEQNRLYLTQADGSFFDATDRLPKLTDFSHSADAGDIDGDGDQDLFVGNGYPGEGRVVPYVLVNDGRGNFTLNRDIVPVAGGQALDILAGQQFPGTILRDLNGDRLPDLIVTADKSSEFGRHGMTTIFWNEGGKFTSNDATRLAETTGFKDHIDLDAETIDINGDGLQDLVVVGTQGNPFYDGSFIQIFRNVGGKSFVDVTATALEPADARAGVPGAASQTSWPIWVTALDFNGDGLGDFAVEYNGAQLKAETPLVFLNDGQGHFNTLKVKDFVAAGSEYLLGTGQLVHTSAGYSFVALHRGPDGFYEKGIVATKPYDGMRAVQAPPPGLTAKEAAVAASGFFAGKAPDAKEFLGRSEFAQKQLGYYRDVLKVAVPELGPYEALGVAFAGSSAFQGRYGAAVIDAGAFVAKAYADVFGRAATPAQQAAFEAQLGYFTGLYAGAGLDPSLAGLQARGAVAGQMTGHVMTSPAERSHSGQTLDDKTVVFLAGIASGSDVYGGAWV